MTHGSPHDEQAWGEWFTAPGTALVNDEGASSGSEVPFSSESSQTRPRLFPNSSVSGEPDFVDKDT